MHNINFVLYKAYPFYNIEIKGKALIDLSREIYKEVTKRN